MVRIYPKQCKKLFVATEQDKISAVSMYSLFKVQISPMGSNLDEAEKQALMFWMTFFRLVKVLLYVYLYCMFCISATYLS